MLQPLLVTASFLSLVNTVHSAQTSKVCPFLGAVYPAPQNLSNNSEIVSAGNSFSLHLDKLLKAGNATTAAGILNLNASSFTVNVFSASEDAFLYQTHHSDPSLLTNSNGGVKIVDENTIYRVGSISKLLTVYLWLVEAGDITFKEPITKYVPELKIAAESEAQDDLDLVRWEDVTVGELAGFMAGLYKESTLYRFRYL